MVKPRTILATSDQILAELWGDEEDLGDVSISSDLDSDTDPGEGQPDKVYDVDVIVQV